MAVREIKTWSEWLYLRIKSTPAREKWDGEGPWQILKFTQKTMPAEGGEARGGANGLAVLAYPDCAIRTTTLNYAGAEVLIRGPPQDARQTPTTLGWPLLFAFWFIWWREWTTHISVDRSAREMNYRQQIALCWYENHAVAFWEHKLEQSHTALNITLVCRHSGITFNSVLLTIEKVLCYTNTTLEQHTLPRQ